MDSLPSGTLDLHVHAAPDRVRRNVDMLGLARTGPAAGLSGAVFKNHHEPTGGCAALVREEAAGFLACGSVVLNHAVGGINPASVDALACNGAGAIVWLPTRDAANDARRKGRSDADHVVVTQDGAPTPQLVAVAECAAMNGLVLASGHLDPAETVIIFEALAPTGAQLIATHVTARVTPFDPDQLDRILRIGATAEICARNLLEKGAEMPETNGEAVAHAVALIRRFGAERFVLSSDLGDMRYPAPIEGLLAVASALSAAGLGDGAIKTMLVDVPRRLLGAPPIKETGHA